MRPSHFKTILPTIVILILSGTIFAQDEASLMVSRDSEGALDAESRIALTTLTNMAARSGYVRVWITLDMPYDPFLAEKSEEAAALQHDQIELSFGEVIGPMLNTGQIRYVNDDPKYSGPSLLLLATPSGLHKLIGDQRVGQMVGVRDQ